MEVLVDICLATYNGERFLEQFYCSLAQQSHKEWSLSVRDDISTDLTRSVINKIAACDSRIHIVNDNYGNLGVIRNFSTLLSGSTSKYVMLADQDDVWYPEKVARSLAAIRELEQINPGHIQPALVFSDLHVVDASLNVIHSSFVHMQGLEKLRQPSFSQLLTQNVAPGCTIIVNRALLDLALPVPVEAAMHDWWLMQVASLFGVIGYIDEPTMAYRQHESNQVGAKLLNLSSLLKNCVDYKFRLDKAQLQVRTLIGRYSERMCKANLETATAFAELSRLPPILRQLTAWRYGLKKSGFMRNIGFYLLM
jgi:glycosyltransferase involved in cell wall biosynthesis